MKSMRQYRLFLTLLVVPVLVIVLVAALIVAISRSGEEEGSVALSTDRMPNAATNTVTGSAAPSVKPSAATIVIPPTQTPVPEPTPVAASSPKTEATPTAPPLPIPTPNPEGPVKYEVKQTDTIFTIAVQFGVSVADLVEFNELPDEDFIFVGQVLEVPTDPAQIIERRESKPKPTTGVVIPAEGLNVRDQPNTETGVIQYVVGGGTELALTGVSKELEGIKWWEVEEGNWVQGQYLELGVKAAPTAAPTEPAASTETPATDGQATPSTGSANPIVATIIPPAGLNVRKAAIKTGEVAYVAATNTSIELSGETTNVEGVVWWQVVDGNWVQGQFLKFG